jgi:hypothetical protein
MASFLILVFIAFERYKKICIPFKTQITVTQSKVISVGSVLLGIPIYIVHGTRHVSVEDINATRCAIENKYDGDLLPILHLGFVFITSILGVVVIVIFQIRIRTSLVNKAKSKQKMKSITSTANSKFRQEKADDGTPHMKSNRAKTSADDRDSERNRRIAISFAIISTFLIVSFVSQAVFQLVIVTQRYLFPKQRISKLEDVMNEYFPDIGNTKLGSGAAEN